MNSAHNKSPFSKEGLKYNAVSFRDAHLNPERRIEEFCKGDALELTFDRRKFSSLLWKHSGELVSVQLQQLLRIVKKVVRIGRSHFYLVMPAPRHTDRFDAGLLSLLHIAGGIADVINIMKRSVMFFGGIKNLFFFAEHKIRA